MLQEGYFDQQHVPSQNGKTNLRFYVDDGLFDLWTNSYLYVYCDMDLTMYPFDSQKCDVVIKSNSKNLTYQGQHILIVSFLI